MSQITSGESHVVESLGLYYMGTSDAIDGEVVEEHLAACAECRAAAQEVCETLAALALVSQTDLDEILENFGPLGRRGPVPESFRRFFGADVDPDPGDENRAAPGREPDDNPGTGPVRHRETRAARSSEPSAPRTVAPEPARRPDRPPHSDRGSPRWLSGAAVVSRLRPTTPRAAGRTGRPRRGRARGLVHAAVMLAIVLTAGGVATAELVQGGTGAHQRIVTTAATAEASDRSTGVSISVIVTPDAHGVTVNATVAGLHPGTGYRLFASTTAGRSVPIVNWTCRRDSEDISGRLPVAVGALGFVTVTRADGNAVVSAYLTGVTGSR
ncbi:zf-HC2 domain-containing protein [Actinoplanes sp. NPDC051343]|uniref:zf-HC2 domain-containing protein n=1 Tax=Actinoplanes sp. NPDC051343 TaxID=3363906 RepID=UPI0037BB7C78